MCSPKLHVFDLNTSQQVKQVTMPHDIAVNATTGKGGLVFLAVQAIDPINTMVSLKVIIFIFLEIFYFSFVFDLYFLYDRNSLCVFKLEIM